MFSCSDGSDQSDAFLDLFLDNDIVPRLNLTLEANIGSSESSPDSSCPSDPFLIDLDLETELEKFLNEECQEPSSEDQLAAFDFEFPELNNNNPVIEDAVEERSCSYGGLPNEHVREVKAVEDHDYCSVRPPVEYINQFQPLPDEPCPPLNRIPLTESNIEQCSKDKKVVFMGRQNVKLHQKAVQMPRSMQSQQVEGEQENQSLSPHKSKAGRSDED